jgi:hypothetical protein
MNSRCPSCTDSPLLIAVTYDPAHFRCGYCGGESFSFNSFAERLGEYFINRNIQLLEMKAYTQGVSCPRCNERMLATRPCQTHSRQERYGVLQPILPHWKGWSEPLEIQNCHHCMSYWVTHDQIKRLPAISLIEDDKYVNEGEPSLHDELITLFTATPAIKNVKEVSGSSTYTWVLSGLCLMGTLASNRATIQLFGFVPAHPFKNHGINLITSLFLHGDYGHLVGNLLFFVTFGRHIEKRMSSNHFILLFFLSGIMGNAGQFLVNRDPEIPGIGASGAISGIIVYFACMFPKAMVYLPVTPIFRMLIRPQFKAPTFAFVWFTMEYIYGLLFFRDGNVGHFAHLGGALGGLLFWIMAEKHE